VITDLRAYLAAVRARVDDLTQSVTQLRAREARDIAEAAVTHGHLGNGYWEARHAAEMRLWTAQALERALAEAQEGA
jgi:hypothetical protein